MPRIQLEQPRSGWRWVTMSVLTLLAFHTWTATAQPARVAATRAASDAVSVSTKVTWPGSVELAAAAVQQAGSAALIAAPEGDDTGGAADTEPGEDQDEDLDVTVGGGMVLWYNLPVEGDGKPFFEIFEARLNLDAAFGRYGLHLTPRFRDSRERGFFVGTTWVEEAYVSATFGPATVKAGKVYRQFGRFWDNSFYGNTQEYDGLKLDPDHGVSLEGAFEPKAPYGLKYFAQYFVIDGTANYALPDRDTHTVAGDHRRNQIVGRVEPFYKLDEFMTFKLGLSGEFFKADIAAIGEQNVGRFALDGTVELGDTLSVWAEHIWQWGRHVAGYPYPASDGMLGRSSDSNNWLLLGGEYKRSWIAVRYNFNQAHYRDLDYKETMHEPGVSVWLDPRLMVLFEWVYWQRHEASVSSLVNHSFNITIHGKFSDVI